MSKLGLMLKDKNKREREVWTHAIRPDPSETESQSPPVGRIRGYDPPVGPTAPWQPSDAQQSAQIPSEREPPLPFTRVPLTSTPPLLTWGPTTRWRDPLVDGAPRCRFSPCPLCFLLINHIYFFFTSWAHCHPNGENGNAAWFITQSVQWFFLKKKFQRNAVLFLITTT